MTELQPSEPSFDPIRADALILLESNSSILHIEFQTLPKNDIPFRVLTSVRDKDVDRHSDSEVNSYSDLTSRSMRAVTAAVGVIS
jgi:hypothetical protein